MTTDPVQLLQQLIRFDTTNPPGNERACIEFIDGLLSEAGCETMIVARDPARPNLVTRIPGAGTVPPLLMYGHVDVVTTDRQSWTHPPFEGRIVDGYVWGRGALDMKGGVAMMLSALLRMKSEGMTPNGDIILAIVSDEEAGGSFGAHFLVERHAELFDGVRHAIGEFGGFTFHVGGRRFYPIQVAEKQTCRVRAVVRGHAGHGSLVTRDGAMAKLGDLLKRVNSIRLPAHVTPVVRRSLRAMQVSLSFPTSQILGMLMKPSLTDRVLDRLGERGAVFDPLLHNTITPTIVRGGDKINVAPEEAEVQFDARLLPGFGPEAFLPELHAALGTDVELELLDFEPGPSDADLSLFDLLSNILRDLDPEGIPIPYLLPAATDARFFSRIGIQTYGFLPMRLPESMNFSRLIHSADERIPVEALEFGTSALSELLERYGR